MAIWHDFSTNNIPASASRFATGQNRCRTKFGKGCKTIGNRLRAFFKGDDSVYQACDDRKHRDEAEQILAYLVRGGQITAEEFNKIVEAMKSVYFCRECPDLSIFEETRAKHPEIGTQLMALHNNIIG